MEERAKTNTYGQLYINGESKPEAWVKVRSILQEEKWV